MRRAIPIVTVVVLTMAVIAQLVALYLSRSPAEVTPRPDGPAVVVSLPCDAEDGRRDGQPCLWRDPGTGAYWLVDSSEYRD